MAQNKTAAIFHGTGCDEHSFWIPWLKDKLEETGYHVWTPSLPKHEDGFAHLDVWENTVIRDTTERHFNLIIGHSAGVPLTFRLLSSGNFSTDNALCVAGFLNPLEGMTPDHPTYPHGLDYPRIKEQGRKFTYIHSDNDPWGCLPTQGEAMRQAFGGILVTVTGEGHFGSEIFQQPYPEFPLLLAHCLL
ncbi:MAG: alpha/beta hydrolase [Rhodospirillales bacterium]|nr:alpha/beta hydrolase [Rhodospirillales bacterium]MCB9964524.1 alpha/beta hydrolase [Rhodospirillales bacterium]MCB9973797.1 alpha/beta hydrolase [Rhodospirillales bacterium]MCB9980319.1 alpha/beta hydrolase [Rhodospirillales bacterium]